LTVVSQSALGSMKGGSAAETSVAAQDTNMQSNDATQPNSAFDFRHM
jgi:hypothetical protein